MGMMKVAKRRYSTVESIFVIFYSLRDFISNITLFLYFFYTFLFSLFVTLKLFEPTFL